MLRSLLGGLSGAQESRPGTSSGILGTGPHESSYFKLSCQSPEQLALLLRARHGLGNLSAVYAAFKADPGEEVHPERLRTSADGFAFTEGTPATQIISTGCLLVERFDEQGEGGSYQRIRAFKSYAGALAEFCAKLEMCAVGSLEVAEGAQRAGKADLKFEGINRTMSLFSLSGSER
jgi:hypothetical protein